VREVASQFVADAALILKELAAAAQDGDVEKFRDEAHALRSCSANVGAQSIYSLCLSWRQISPQEFAAEGRVYVEKLEQEYEKARLGLAPYIDQAACAARSASAFPAFRRQRPAKFRRGRIELVSARERRLTGIVETGHRRERRIVRDLRRRDARSTRDLRAQFLQARKAPRLIDRQNLRIVGCIRRRGLPGRRRFVGVRSRVVRRQ
jgi:HPt (histidine-containing phosphotransfer) domain-containing protein